MSPDKMSFTVEIDCAKFESDKMIYCSDRPNPDSGANGEVIKKKPGSS